MVASFRAGGRLFYVGAGTSGRLGVLDASECPPTFGSDPDMVQGVIAGGYGALVRAVEGAEDRAAEGEQAMVERGVGPKDTVIGLAASRRTPFVVAALAQARVLGARTVYVTCTPREEFALEVDVAICPEVGPEVLMGSTRMKSGTAQKLVLNMITTAAFIRMGKAYENMMVDLMATSQKLVRAQPAHGHDRDGCGYRGGREGHRGGGREREDRHRDAPAGLSARRGGGPARARGRVRPGRAGRDPMKRLARWILLALAAVMLAALSCAPAEEAGGTESSSGSPGPTRSWARSSRISSAPSRPQGPPSSRSPRRVGQDRSWPRWRREPCPTCASSARPGCPGCSRAAGSPTGAPASPTSGRNCAVGSSCSMGDAIYGVPWVLRTRALFYNKTLFARARLDSTRPPETWDELYRAAAAIQRLGHGVHGYGVQAGERQRAREEVPAVSVRERREHPLRRPGRAVFDSAANVKALEFFLSLRRVGMLGRQDALDREFEEGRLGLELSGAWLFERIAGGGSRPALRRGAGAEARGAGGGTHASLAGRRGAGHLQRLEAQAPGAGARALPGAAGERAPARRGREERPARDRGADTAAYYRERPAGGGMVRQLERARFTPNHPAWDDMEAAIEDEVEQALYDRKSPAQAVKDAQTKLAKLVGKR